MPIKKDGTGRRWVEMEFLAPGTPEQLWQAMATGPGYTAWFTRVTIEERIGGAIRFHFGPDLSTSGEVTFWEPPHRVGYVEKEWNGDAPPVATEITIAGRGGGQCVVRMVHSLFASTDDWDDQLESFENGWPACFEILRLYLRHFAGQKGASFQAMTSVEGGDHAAIWARLAGDLGLAGANVGDTRAAPSAPEPLTGVVERVHQDGRQRYVILRGDAPAGLLLAGTYGIRSGVNLSLSVFFYGEDAEQRAAAAEAGWRDWLTDRFGGAPVTECV